MSIQTHALAAVRSARRFLITMLVAVAALTSVGQATAAPPGVIPLGAAYADQRPATLVAADGTIHAAWVNRINDPVVAYDLHYRRTVGGTTGPDVILPRPLPEAAYTSVQFLEDVARKRLYLFVGTFTSGVGPGGWVLMSHDAGATWSVPTLFWDSFFVGTSFSLRPDGAIGMVPGLTGVSRLIIPFPGTPPQFALQASASFNLDLSDRISSRNEVHHAFGPDGFSYTMFEAADGGWIHLGSTGSVNAPFNSVSPEAGAHRDRQLTPLVQDMELAGGARGAGVLGANRFSPGPIAFYRLGPDGVVGTSTIPHFPGDTTAEVPKLLVSPDGTFYAVWKGIGATTSGLMMSWSEDGGATWKPAVRLMTLQDIGFGTDITAFSQWSVGGPSNNKGAAVWYSTEGATSGQAVLWTFDAKPSLPAPLQIIKPRLVSTLGQFTSKGYPLTVRTNRSGKVRVTLRQSGKAVAVWQRNVSKGVSRVFLKTTRARKGKGQLVVTGLGSKLTIKITIK